MEYHEIGDRFEYNGVMLEVVGGYGSSETDCVNCALVGKSPCLRNFCTPCNRKDERNVYYKLVKQCEPKDMEQKAEIKVDNVNHPAHYNSHPSGIECIEIAHHHNFNIGNAIKYLWRTGLKSEKDMEDADKQVEDLRKAIFYINDEIERIKKIIKDNKANYENSRVH